MKDNEIISIPVWGDRVSPVFDYATRILVVKTEKGVECSRFETSLDGPFLAERINKLKSLGVHTLVCGAISRPLHYMLINAGIEVIPWISGSVNEVLEAFLKGKLYDVRFFMPGSKWYWAKGHGRRRGQTMGRRRGIYF